MKKFLAFLSCLALAPLPARAVTCADVTYLWSSAEQTVTAGDQFQVYVKFDLPSSDTQKVFGLRFGLSYNASVFSVADADMVAPLDHETYNYSGSGTAEFIGLAVDSSIPCQWWEGNAFLLTFDTDEEADGVYYIDFDTGGWTTNLQLVDGSTASNCDFNCQAGNDSSPDVIITARHKVTILGLNRKAKRDPRVAAAATWTEIKQWMR